jgi:FAD/FMN-containing dehydrogenase
MSVTLDDSHIRDLAGRVSGRVLAPEDPGYDDARAVHNGLIDKHPAVIVRCRTSEDVVAGLAFARTEGLDVSVRGGGHNVAGRAVAEGGVMIDLAEMKAIAVNADERAVTAGGGCLWAELNEATGAHGLAVTGGVISSTGIGGLTLGGGLGWLMARYGLAADNLIAAEVVTAAGEIVRADDASHPDLMWALRGGGGNFGVVTAFTYRLHPLAMVTGGLIAYPFADAGDVLRRYRDAVAGVSDDCNVFAGLVHAPDGSGHKLCALIVCHTGEEETAERELAPFKELGSPLVAEVGRMPYPVVNTLLDGGFPKGACNYWLSAFARGVSDALIDAAVERYDSVPSPMTGLLLEHFHGAVTRIGETDTAVPHRAPGWNLLIAGVWPDPDATADNVAWTRETYAALQPELAARRWLNYLGDDQGGDAIRDAYGPNYERLREVKRRYDPTNVFHQNHNIAP